MHGKRELREMVESYEEQIQSLKKLVQRVRYSSRGGRLPKAHYRQTRATDALREGSEGEEFVNWKVKA